jgi:hypothetical protein
MLLLPEGQKGESWEASKTESFFRNPLEFDRKVLQFAPWIVTLVV